MGGDRTIAVGSFNLHALLGQAGPRRRALLTPWMPGPVLPPYALSPAIDDGRTVLAVARRLHTARDADRVAVVEDGRLVASEGAYPRLWNSWHGERNLVGAT